MKKSVLVLAAFFAFGYANAQDMNESTVGFSKGDAVATGRLSLNSSKYTANGNYKESSYDVSPALGVFISDNIAIGAGLNLGNSTVEATPTSGKSKENRLGFELFGRYYFTPADKFSFFGHLSGGYTNIHKKDIDVKLNSFGVMAAPGVNYFISKNFALEATWGILSYSNLDSETPGEKATQDFNLAADLSNINFGFLYKF